jgi:uncharacterized protein (TIGR02145 family)
MKSKVLILFLLFSLLYCSTKSQTITNVVAKQDGDNVVITYNLQCEGDAEISLSMSEDGGSIFKGPLKSVSGDIGVSVKPGNKTIIWNTLNDQEMIFGDNIVFRVIILSKFGKFTDSRDGKIYKTVKIGTQTWMAENLAYKANNGGCWAYDNNESNVKIYGYLYNLETANKVCPAGWHIATDAEWTTLTNYFGGDKIAGGKLKEAGTFHWKRPNIGATNEAGFTALPGGYRLSNETFYLIGSSGNWWSSADPSTSNAWERDMDFSYSNLGRASSSRDPSVQSNGLSVRCVKD